MELIEFASFESLAQDALALLRGRLADPQPGARAVMLTGGRTPLGLYAELARSPVAAGPGVHVLLSDERHVPLAHAESNFGHMGAMLGACGVDARRIHRVHTELPLDEAAARYNAELGAFLGAGGTIPLGFLGLGADGHLASLFSAADMAAGAGRWAIAVRRPQGAHRVSVTRELLWRVERTVFLVAGSDKSDAVDRLFRRPETVPAGVALAGKDHVEVWYAR